MIFLPQVTVTYSWSRERNSKSSPSKWSTARGRFKHGHGEAREEGTLESDISLSSPQLSMSRTFAPECDYGYPLLSARWGRWHYQWLQILWGWAVSLPRTLGSSSLLVSMSTDVVQINNSKLAPVSYFALMVLSQRMWVGCSQRKGQNRARETCGFISASPQVRRGTDSPSGWT